MPEKYDDKPEKNHDTPEMYDDKSTYVCLIHYAKTKEIAVMIR